MAHIPMDDVEKLWQQAPHSWSGLAQYAEQHQGKAEGFADYLMIDIPQVAKGMQGQTFPGSEDELYKTLNEKLKDMPHHTTEARAQFGEPGAKK